MAAAARSHKGKSAKPVSKSSGHPDEAMDVDEERDHVINDADNAFWTQKVEELERQLTSVGHAHVLRAVHRA